MERFSVRLKRDNSIVTGDLFTTEDFPFFQEIFLDWLDVNEKLVSLGGRKMNVPEVFSEALYCMFFEAIRTNGVAYSYDCVDIATGEGVQVKSASISNDCTSFGPTSTWDKLIFVDMCPNFEIDGVIDFYNIDYDIYSLVLNSQRGETFRDQQQQGRRPRFSIKNRIIRPNNLLPILTVNLNSGEVIHYD